MECGSWTRRNPRTNFKALCGKFLESPPPQSLSHKFGKIPRDWKFANLVPVRKNEIKADVENFTDRPISFSSLIRNTFKLLLKEKLITNHILNAKEHNFLSTVENCVPPYNMIGFLDSVFMSLNYRNAASIDIVFYFAKAFPQLNSILFTLSINTVDKQDSTGLS